MDRSSIDIGSRFLASTLHEIRTPIQTIISTIELLEDTTLDKEQTEYVHQIDFSANILLQLANDVLDYTKITSDEFKLESLPYDLTELIEHVVDLVSIEAFNKGLEVTTDIDYSIPKTVMGDPARVQQTMLNLVKNAVKFTRSGYVQVRATTRNSDLSFEVIDSGIGVPVEKQLLIFNEFYQVDASTTRNYGGTGLGLSICKNLVGIMGGRIGVRANPAGGSIFWFTLPLRRANLDAERPFKLEVPWDTRVLLVDDSKLALQSMADKLIDFGIHSVETATSGEEAIAKVEAAAKADNPFTMAYIDMIMPKMDGWRTAAEIKDGRYADNLKMYLLVPEGQMGKDAKMKTLNWYNGYLYKPIKRNQLLNSLIEAFSQAMELIPVETSKDAVPEEAAQNKPRQQIRFDDSTLAAGNKILVAEDHPVNRKIIDTFLEKYGATVFLAENGEEAVQAIAQTPDIDMIFMDILMPVKSGIDATVELRNSGYKGIIIACTANNDPDDFKEYLQLGINDILVKPFKRETIKQMLEKWKIVLSLPAAKDIMSLADLTNQASDLWDVGDFMDTVGGDMSLATSIMDEFVTHTEGLLEQVKHCLQQDTKDTAQLDLLTHTLKGSSASVSAMRLAESGRGMNEAVRRQDYVAAEAFRVDFALDFVEFKKLVANWQSAEAAEPQEL